MLHHIDIQWAAASVVTCSGLRCEGLLRFLLDAVGGWHRTESVAFVSSGTSHLLLLTSIVNRVAEKVHCCSDRLAQVAVSRFFYPLVVGVSSFLV